MAKKKSKTQKLKKSVKKVQKKKVTTTASKKSLTPKKTNNDKKVTSTKKLTTTKKINTPKRKNEDIIELPKKKEYKKGSNKGKVVSKNKVEYKIYEKQQQKKTPPRKSEIKRVVPQKPTKKIEETKEIKIEPKELDIKDIKEIKDVDLNKTINIIFPKKETTKKEKPIVAPKKEVKSTLLDKLFAKKENKKKILTTNTKNINDLKALFNGPSKKEKKESKIKAFFAKFKKKESKKKVKVSTKVEEPIIEPEEIEEEPKKEHKIPTNPVLKFFYEILINLYIFFDVLLIATFIFLIIGLKRVEVIPNNYIIYIAGIFIFLGFFAFAYNKYISGKIFTLCLVAVMGAGIYLLQYNFDFINNLNTKEYEYKEYNVVAFDNAYNKSIYNINNKKVCLLSNNAKNEERVLNLKLDDVEYLTYETQDEMFEDFYKGKCRAVVVTSNQIKFLVNSKEKETQNIKTLYTFKANGRK